MFTYRSKLVKIIDGDTVDLDVDLGFNITHRIRVRLADIDTPEVRGWQKQYGLAATDAALDWFEESEDQLYVETEKTGKYGRWLARIYRENQGQKSYLHDHLIDGGWEKDNFHK